MKRMLVALALASSAGLAMAQLFTIEEGAVDGTPDNLVDADKLTLRYEASIEQTAAGSFTENGFYTVTGYGLGNSAVTAFLNSPEPSGYQLYGSFSVSGTIAFVGTTALGTFTSGDFALWLDVNSDSTQTVAAGGAPVFGNNGDDILVATASGILGGSQVNVPLVGDQAATGGSYVINYDNFMLTAFGETFFIAPESFYLQVNVTGENEQFVPPLVEGDYVGLAEGDASAEFAQVPEPASLALAGLALFALGAVGRRRS